MTVVKNAALNADVLSKNARLVLIYFVLSGVVFLI